MVMEQEQMNHTINTRQCSNGSLCFENNPELTRGSWLVTALCIFVLVLNTCIGLPSNIWALWKIMQSKKLSRSNFCIIQHLIASLVGCLYICPVEAIHQGLIFMTDVPNHLLYMSSLFVQLLVNACLFSCTIYIAIERLQNIRNHFVKRNNYTAKKVILSILWIVILPFAIVGLYIRNVYGFKDSHFSCKFLYISWVEQLNCFIQILPFCLFTITLSTVVGIYIVCIIELRKKTQLVRPSSNVTSLFSQPKSSMNENHELFHYTKYDAFATESEGDDSRHLPIKFNTQVELTPLSFLRPSSSSTEYKLSTGSSFSSTNPPSSTSSEKTNTNYQQAKNSAITKMFTVTETTENYDPKNGFNPELDDKASKQLRKDSSDSFHFDQKQKIDDPPKVNLKKSKTVRTTSEESDYTLEKAFRKMSDISLASITTNTLPFEGPKDGSDVQKAKYTLNPLRHTRRSAGNVWTLEPIPDFPNTENIWKLKPKIPHKLAPISFQKKSNSKKKKKRKTKIKKQISNNSIGTCSLTSNKSASSKFTNSEMSEYSSTQSFSKKFDSMMEPSIDDSLVTMESQNSQIINLDRDTAVEIVSASDTFKTMTDTDRDSLQKTLQPAEEDGNIAQYESSQTRPTQNLTSAKFRSKNQNNDSEKESMTENERLQSRFLRSTVFTFDSDNDELYKERCQHEDQVVLDFEDVLPKINMADDDTLLLGMCTLQNSKSLFDGNMLTELKMKNYNSNLDKYKQTDDEMPSFKVLSANNKMDENSLKLQNSTNSDSKESFDTKFPSRFEKDGRKFRFEINKQYDNGFNLNSRKDAVCRTTMENSVPKSIISSSTLKAKNEDRLFPQTEEPSGDVNSKNLKDYQSLWKPMPVIVSDSCPEDVFLSEETKLNKISKNDRYSDPFVAQNVTKAVENLNVPHFKPTNEISRSSSSISSSYLLRPSKTKYSSTSTINSVFSRPMRSSAKTSAIYDESSDGSVAFFKNSKSEDELKFMLPISNQTTDLYDHIIHNNNSDSNLHEKDLPTITESLSLKCYLDDKISPKKAIQERVNEWHCHSRPDTCMSLYGRLAKSLQDLRKIDRPSIFNIEESSLSRVRREMTNSTTQTDSEIITINAEDLLMERHYLDDNNTSHPIIRVIRPSLPSPKTLENLKKNDDHGKICQTIEEITEEGNLTNTQSLSNISKPSCSSTIPKSVSINQMYKPGKNPFTELNVCITLKRVLLILIPFTILFMPLHLEIFLLMADFLHIQNYIKVSKSLLCIYYSCSSFIYVFSSKNLMKSLKVAKQSEQFTS